MCWRALRVVASPTPAFSWAIPFRFFVGSRNNELQRYFQGDLHEVVVYDRSLSEAEQTATTLSLQTKWAVPALRCRGPPAQQPVISQKYALTRYVQAIQSRGTRWPIKFNGMMFVANTPPNADARDWGPCNWWQNTRLPYGAMLAAGDTDTYQVGRAGRAKCTPFARATLTPAAASLRHPGHPGLLSQYAAVCKRAHTDVL